MLGGANRRLPRESPSQRGRPAEQWRRRGGRAIRLDFEGHTSQAFLGGLTEPIRVDGPGDLLMRLREHSTHKTAGALTLFPAD